MANILFVLPAGGYSGGANSVVQETKGLRRIGQKASIAVDQKNIASFRRCYSTEFEVLGQTSFFKDYADLKEKLNGYDIVVATVGAHATRVYNAVRAVNQKHNKKIRLAYYIQDYEPFFFDKSSPEWKMTRASYDEAQDVTCFAKTDWICRVVETNHGIRVKRVMPSIDHDCYFPTAEQSSEIVISAMLRPGTPRRAPRRTARILNRLADKFANRIKLVSFGCDKNELAENGILLHGAVNHHGLLTREQVAQILRDTELFLDLSDFQAFGRTGIESMACGAVPVMPIAGGASEFVSHGQNGYLVDSRYDSLILELVDQFISLPRRKREMMRSSALETASQFSIHRAAISMRNVLLDGLA